MPRKTRAELLAENDRLMKENQVMKQGIEGRDSYIAQLKTELRQINNRFDDLLRGVVNGLSEGTLPRRPQ